MSIDSAPPGAGGAAAPRTSDPAPRRPLRILFVFRNLGYVRLFDAAVRALLASGHRIHLLYEQEADAPTEVAWLADISREPGFTSTLSDAIVRDRWAATARFLRRLSDYLHARSPTFTGGSALVARSSLRVDPRLRTVLQPLVRRERVRSLLERVVDLLEAAVPVNRLVVCELAAVEPDLLVLAPHLMPGSRHQEYVRAARSLHLRTCMCIASWDNLSTKQRIREIPDRVVVWNEVQRREAITLHDVPSDRVAITGAQSFDEWFARRPRERSNFCARVGLDASRPYILYVGGALFPAELTEAEWVLRRWIPELRRDPRLRDTGILVRPHPRRLEQWARVSFDGIENAVAWPSRDAPMPVDEDSRADFFDSLYHSAVVVGINTTAMIEAAVVGRAVHTILAPEFAESQVGTRHFAYLREVAGGVVRTAHSFDEHRDQLALALAGGDAEGERRRVEFLRAFVRPHGLERPALPYLVAEIEGVAALGPAPKAHTSPALLPVRAALRVTMAASRAVRLLRHR